MYREIQKKYVLKVFGFLLPVLFLLTACGGGGDAPPGDGGTTVSGLASKGPINGGALNIYQVNADGSQGNSLGSTTTGVDGTYSVNIGSYSGNIIVEVTGGDYTDEATVATVSNGTLRAVVAGVNSDVTVAVTPLTEIAAEKAAQMVGIFTSINIIAANNIVSNMIGGVDIISTLPADVTDPSSSSASSDAQNYGLMLAGISQMVDGSPSYTDVSECVTAIVDDLSDSVLNTVGSEITTSLDVFIVSGNNVTGLTAADTTLDDAIADATTTPISSSDPSSGWTTIPVPIATITVDGDVADWGSIAPARTDSLDDQVGNINTDLSGVYMARSGSDIVLRLDVQGAITFPHTPSQLFSHYEIGIHPYNGPCDTGTSLDDFFVVNTFGDAGNTFNGLDYYVNQEIQGSQFTNISSSGSSLEVSFPESYLGFGFTHVWLNPYVQSFDGTGNPTMHDEITGTPNTCIELNSAASTPPPPPTGSAIAGSWGAGGNTTDNLIDLELTFYPNGAYVHYGDNPSEQYCIDTPGLCEGLEFGVYTYNSVTEGLTATSAVDANFDHGLTSAAGGTFDSIVDANETWKLVGPDTFEIYVNGVLDNTLQRVVDAANPIVGSWHIDDPNYNIGTFTLTFYPNGTYFHWQAPDANCNGGEEYGTYTYDSVTEELSITSILDTNEDCGLTEFSVPNVLDVQVNGNSLSITDPAGMDTFTRVEVL